MGAFGKLNKRGYGSRHLSMKTKIKTYEVCILATLLYGSECWTAYALMGRKLHMLNEIHEGSFLSLTGLHTRFRA